MVCAFSVQEAGQQDMRIYVLCFFKKQAILLGFKNRSAGHDAICLQSIKNQVIQEW